jgi:molybdenum cofactor synthesis domain-containing protein
MKTAVLILSDKGSKGERVDKSGPILAEWLAARGAEITRTAMIPDEAKQIEALLKEWADSGAFDLIITCGGTGVSPRDVTPDATKRAPVAWLGNQVRWR